MTSGVSFEECLAQDRQKVEQVLDQLLPTVSTTPPRLHEAMRYAVFAGGKRLRPLLTLYTCRACGGHEGEALPVAAAVEMIHTYSLIHDDLPAMDNDTLRRGKPTTHVVYGEALAILAGNALLTRAFELLAHKPPGNEVASRRLAISAAMAGAAGSDGMVGGQVLDLAAEGTCLDHNALKDLHARKTGALITASVVVGGLCADADSHGLQPLRRYGTAIGLAFQIMDDVLDVTGSDTKLGKSAGKDQQAGKSTFPALLGLAASRAEVERLVQTALSALDSFGAEADSLRQVARFIGERDH